jgi:hypothetical protein
MPIPTITTLPTPPTRQDPTNFADRADSFLGALPTFVTELNAVGDDIEASQTAAENASTYAWEAVDAAALVAGTTVWVTGTNYAQYASAIDPIDFKNYRTKTAGISNTRPGVDLSRWQLLSGLGDVTTDTTQTITGSKTFTNGTDFTTVNSGRVGHLRNKIINGNHIVSQTGVTSWAAVTNDQYLTDQWQFRKTGAVTAVLSATRTNEMSEFGLLYPVPLLDTPASLRATVTTAQASLGTGDELVGITQPIEGQFLTDLVGKPFSLSFWVKSDRAGTYCIALKRADGVYNLVREYVVNTVNTWEKKTLVIEGINLSHNTWSFTTTKSIELLFVLAAGASYRDSGTVGSWTTAPYLATTNQVNFVQTVGHKFAITGIQLESGPVATAFENTDLQTMTEQCKRYFRLSPAFSAWTVSTTTATVPMNDFAFGMRIQAPTIALFNGIGTFLDPTVAVRNITSITASATPHYLDLTVPATTANKMHVIFTNSFTASARM